MTVQTPLATDVVASMYQSVLDGDVERLLGHIGEGFLLEEPPFLPYGGTVHGVEGFQKIFAGASSLLDLSTLQLQYIFGSDERACGVLTCDVAGNEKRATLLEEWKVSDGKIIWGRVYWFDPAVVS